MSSFASALIEELRARFHEPSVAYCGIVVPACEGVLARAIVDAVPNYSIVGIDADEVTHHEFGTAGQTECEGERSQMLDGVEARVLVLKVGLRDAVARLNPRRFDFLVWDDEDWTLLDILSPLVRPGGLIALASGDRWVLR